MICPSCGNETSSEQAFCVNCGAFVRSEFGRILSPERPAVQQTPQFETWLDEIEDADPDDRRSQSADQILWPAEAVFIPTADEELDLPPGRSSAAETIFEDAQADDFFEQSLSGKVRREDLLIDDARPEETVEPAFDPKITQPIYFEALQEVPMDAAEDQATRATRPRSRLITTLRFLGTALLLAAIFAGGVLTGSRMRTWLVSDPPPQAVVVPAAAPEPAEPVPPTGMAYVPGGEFMMGDDKADPLSRPAHFVALAPYFIDITEVTNEQYRKFLVATGQTPPLSWKDGVYRESEANFPVTGVTWYEAAEYAAWSGKRLPTEAEWEFAARGTDGRVYPWGNEWDPSLANAGDKADGVRNAGEGGRSPFGLLDMAGNAWEWTSSDARPYPGGKEFPSSRLRLKVIRGGNWQSGERTATTYFRGYYGGDGEREYRGTSFRCVKDIVKEQK